MNAQPSRFEPQLRAESERIESLSATLLAGVLAVVPDAIAVVNAAGEYSMVSAGFSRHFGWERGEAVGRRVAGFLDASDQGRVQTLLGTAQEAGAEDEWPMRHRCADGITVGVQVRCRALVSSGQLYRVLVLHPEPKPAPRRVVAGRLQLIGLEQVREHLGARWEAVAERAYATAEAVIRRRLDRQDVMSRSDDGFLVCFAGISEDEAAFKAAAISEEITRRLVGEVAESAAQAVSFTAEISIPPGAEGDALDQAVLQGLKAAKAAAVSDAGELLKRAAARATLRPEPVLHVTGRRSGLVLAEMDDGVGGQAERLAALGWSGQEPDVPAEMILLRLQLACAWAAAGADRGTILVPAPWASLSQRRVRERVAWQLLKVPRPVRERVGFEVRGVPADAARSRLFEVISALTALSRPPGIELSAPAASGLLEGVAQRLEVVTMHADSLFLPGLARAEALVRELSAWRIRLLVRAVDQEDQFTALYAMGMPLVVGRALDGGDPRG